MIRWWDDPRAALAVLDRIDDSDVVQGVGSAVLGYHALAKAALVPLASTTLIDAADIGTALRDLDVTLVAKALGEATRPVMGQASEAYGRMLAQEMAENAVAAAYDDYQALVAKGVASPLAVARVAEVAGLPRKHTGRYVEAVSKAAMPPLVISDHADRALMDYAAHLGAREATPHAEAVSKSIAFEEEEHPRADDGKFRTKPTTTLAEADPRRKARRERMARQNRINAQAAQSQRAIVAAETAEKVKSASTLSQLAAFLRPAAARENVRANARPGVTREAGTRERAKVAVHALNKPYPLEYAQGIPATRAEAAPGYRTGVWVTEDQLRQVGEAGQFFMGRLRSIGVNLEMVTHKGAISEADLPAYVNDSEGMVFLEFSGEFVFDEGSDSHGEAIATDQAQYQLLEGASVEDFESDRPRPKGLESSSFRVARIALVNREDFPDRTAARFSKAVRERWMIEGKPVERFVERNREGEFSAQGAVVEIDEARRARMERQARQARLAQGAARNQRVLRDAEAARAAPQTLGAVAAATRANPRSNPRMLARANPRANPRAEARTEAKGRFHPMADSQVEYIKEILSREAVALSPDDFRAAFNMDSVNPVAWLDELASSGAIYETQDIGVTAMKDRTTLGEALQTWARRGSEGASSPVLMGGRFKSVKAAAQIAETRQRHSDNTSKEVQDFKVVRRTDGSFGVVKTTYVEPKIIMHGDPAAMAAMRRGRAVELHVTRAATVADLDEMHQLGIFTQNAPIVEVEVRLAHDGTN